IPSYQAGAMVQKVPLSTTMTPAMVIGNQVEWIACGLGIAGLAVGLLLAPRRRRRRG
ncbi:MAG: apolipoprotein N-acyltransferase, partial [Microbacteriaceae bacterium]|nr:apolipoprotein N-acyltransferase [Microbacteriaceae bacterium]